MARGTYGRKASRGWISMLAAALIGIAGSDVRAFCVLEIFWPTSQVVISYNFPPSGTLLNGTTSWAQNAVSAIQEWSSVSSAFQFINGGESGAGQNNVDGINNMVFDSQVAGNVFEDDVLALTVTRANIDGEALESDVVFNSRVSWDAYNGPIRIDASGQIVFDFRRVALHELGHVLGLDHPDDQCGEMVDAIMNAETTDTDQLTVDDRNGLAFIYGGANSPPVAAAGDDLFGDGIEPFQLNGGASRDFDGEIVLYEWLIDGVVVAEGRVTQILLRRGTYIVELRVTDNVGASASDSLVITVGSEFTPPQPDNEPPVAVTGGDVSVSAGTLVTLDGSNSFDPDGTIASFQWSEGETILSNDPTIQVVFPAGVHIVTLTVVDNVGDASFQSITVMVLDEGISTDPPESLDSEDTENEVGQDVQPSSPIETTVPLCGMLDILPQGFLLGLPLVARYFSAGRQGRGRLSRRMRPENSNRNSHYYGR